MNCSDLKGLADLYLDGDLAEELRGRVERHLLRCRDCAYQIRTLEQTRVLLRAAFSRAEAPSAFRERAEARLLDHLSDSLKTNSPEHAGQWILPLSEKP